MKTPGPLGQKIRAVKTRVKSAVAAKAKSVGTMVKQEVRGLSTNARQRAADMQDDNTLGYVKRQDRVSARRAERVKRRNERNDTGRVISKTNPNTLDRRKRVAREQIIADFSPNTFKGKTKREINKIADGYIKEIKNRPRTDAEKRKRDNKLQRNAVIGNTSIGAGSSSGVSAAAMQNVCPVTATNGGKKGTKCAPKKAMTKTTKK
jgi:hypothetical protein